MLTQDNKTRIDRPIPVGLPINQNAHKHLIGPIYGFVCLSLAPQNLFADYRRYMIVAY